MAVVVGREATARPVVRHRPALELLALRGVAPRSGATAAQGNPFRPLPADGLVAARQAPPARNRVTPSPAGSLFRLVPDRWRGYGRVCYEAQANIADAGRACDGGWECLGRAARSSL